MKKYFLLFIASVFLFSCGVQAEKEIGDKRDMIFYQDIDSCKRQPELYWCQVSKDVPKK
jgi:uncharacterized protein YcfL